MSFRILLITLQFILAFNLKAQWEQTNGPQVGKVTCSLVKDGDIFVGTYGSGIYVSSDTGKSWQSLYLGIPELYIKVLATNGTDIFAGTYHGVYWSPNKGKKWVAINKGWGNGNISVLVWKENELFAGTDGEGVFKLNTTTLKWSRANKGIKEDVITSMVVQKEKIFAGTYRGLFSSNDGGQSWNKMNHNILDSFYVGPLVVQENVIYAGMSGKGLYVSKNNGVDWSLIDIGLVNPDISALGIKDSTIYIGIYSSDSNSSILVSYDLGGSWKFINNGYNNSKVNAINFIEKDAFIATDGGLFKWNTNLKQWEKTTSIKNAEVTSLIKNGASFYTTTLGGGILKSNDSCNSWFAINNGIDYPYLTTMGSVGGNIIAGSYHGAYLTRDSGKSWNKIQGLIRDEHITSFATKGSVIYAGTNDKSTGVVVSHDSGYTWISLNNGLDDKNIYNLLLDGKNLYAMTHTNVYIYDFTLDYWHEWGRRYYSYDNMWKVGNMMFATDYYSTYLLDNKSGYWNEIYQLPNGISTFTTDGKSIFAGSYNNGVYVSINNGINWFEANEGLRNKSITTLLVDGEKLYAGTRGGSVWQRNLKEILNDANPLPAVEDYITLYPNPTKGRFTIEGNKRIDSLKIYNLLGQRVYYSPFFMLQLNNETDLSFLKRGVYYVKIYAEDKIYNRKIVVE